ncbi:hypothetical protein PAXRUDRAFT_17913 [Paxillus rubicundulus Ve08.2h10]|uniref:DUF6589 domain-containing protein n=1 Tax=Paxillus rubicundulus Ve08.2h10 TaxID=930991 RepID=A0A0D0DG48_9AGAM|nr:hypothetical protein PAXRUDRAFT_17913 [Paxillus rubicundulus Ve08.2h10]
MELKKITSEDSGWHFGALNTTTKQLEDFSLEKMARDMGSDAPELCRMIGLLLDDEGSGIFDGEKDVGGPSDVAMGDDDGYWDEVNEIDLEGFISGLVADKGLPSSTQDKHRRRRAAIVMIKKTITISILMQSTNQKANAPQSILGIFLQSAHTPQKVIDTLAHIGISISTETINCAIRLLSVASQENLCALGQSLLASYVYDNFDVDLKSHVPIAEKSDDSLKHLTSGLLFPLVHGITTDDLKCSEELWSRSALNPRVNKAHLPPKKTWRDLLSIHPELSTPHQPTRRDRFNSWVFLSDLCTHGPEYFCRFKGGIANPEGIDQIPVVKTEITAARAMDVNNSTVSGNIRAVVDLLQQGGIYDPVELVAENLDTPDISQHVVLIHGDLGTGEQLQGIHLRRSIEATPWDRFQHIVFIPGLFHLKMACAEAIWCCFIHPPTAREDETSLIHDVALLRPKETGIYCSKPGFRRTHQLIGHAGICQRLDCWRVHIKMKGFCKP